MCLHICKYGFIDLDKPILMSQLENSDRNQDTAEVYPGSVDGSSTGVPEHYQ